jgi:hypothetical protein
MSKDKQQAAAQAQAANPNVMNVNELKTFFSDPKADIPIFDVDHTKGSITANFILDRIKIAQASYFWLDAATARNFKLALQGKAIDWVNYINDAEQIETSQWSRIEPQFKSHYDIQIQTVDNVWDLYQQNSSNGQANKSQGKKKNKSSAAYDAITCWFCNK